MAAPFIVTQLIQTFDDHIDHYQSNQYNETELRREFLDPLFEALGWDMNNRAGYADAYKDVVHEDSLKIGGVTKAPDYSFRIGGTRKFFLEAKKPAIDIRSGDGPAFQLRRYAWSAKLPLSILSNFRELAVYDTRVQPHQSDKPSVARVLHFTYRELVDRWDEIAAVFSREAILRGSFDKYADTNKRKRGTTEVDDAFLEEIERWREILAKNLALRNAGLSERDLNYAVQMTIDRIIFLRICEDRGTEEYGRLQSVTQGPNTYAKLLTLFREADERYNSGLFHFDHERGEIDQPDTLTPALAIDDRILKNIVKNIYYPDSPYEFSVFSANILGQVYERFLGKTITLDHAHRATVEEKPEVRKAGGVYYTPTYVVEYIIKSTLDTLLDGPDTAKPKPIPITHASEIKVLDPACGSGSFLIVAYQRLLDWHLARYIENSEFHSRGRNPRIYQSRGGLYRLTTAERKRILLNNIYGVDIDRQAVEVTKLSLLLKVLEGETEQVVQRDWVRERQRILPDLAANIRCGNSLIDSSFYESEQMLLLDEETQYRVNVFDWSSGFPEVMQRGGFDCVVGNPPYGATLNQEEKEFFRQSYTCQSYQLDTYLLFLEKVLSDLQRTNGKSGFIVPNPWLTNLRQDATRRFLCLNSSIEQIVHFGFPVFRSAVVDTEIVIFTLPAAAANVVNVFSCDEVRAGTPILRPLTVHLQSDWIALDGGVINIFMDTGDKDLFQKVSQSASPLSRHFQINVGIKPYQKGKGTPAQTRQTVDERPFDSERKVNKTYRQLLRGGDINRYVVNPIEQRYISYGPWLAEPRPAANFDASEKLLVRQTGDRPIAALDTNQRLAMNNLHVLVPIAETDELDIRYFLAILNSRLATWFYRCLNPEAGEALAEVKRENVAALPIPELSLKKPADRVAHEKLVSLSRKMEELQQQSTTEHSPEGQRRTNRLIDALDQQIDRVVYALFKLTPEEIARVERATSQHHSSRLADLPS